MGFIFNDEEESILAPVYNIYDLVVHTIEYYGWYLLIFSVVFAIIYNKKLKPLLDNYRKIRFEREYAAKYHKNPDLLNVHVTAQQRFVEKLQEKYNKEMEEKLRQQKEKEERKRQELIQLLEGDDKGGVKLGSKMDAQKSTSLRPEYNPLMGPGSSSNYRPAKKSACGGGGCGGKK